MTNSVGDWYDSVEHAEVSDVGMRRPNNQDAYTVVLAAEKDRWLRRGHVLIVADGMGAHAAGELASQMAVENIPATYHRLANMPPAAAITTSIVKTNLLIHSHGQARADFHGMGTTCSVLLLLPDGAVVAHVGDSRVYRLRRGRIDQLTFDHSLFWEMMAATRMSEDQIPVTVPRNVITRSLGPNPTVDVDLEGPFPIEQGDRYLLCSDGLTGLVRDEEIGLILGCLTIQDAVQTLVDLANLRGGNDNITVLALGVGARPAADEPRPNASELGPVEPTSRVRHRYVSTLLWTASGICLLVAAFAFASGLWAPAIFCLAGGLAAAGVARGRTTRVPAPQRAQRHGLLGRGPHRGSDCHPTRSLVDALARDVLSRCRTAEHEETTIDLAELEACRYRAETAMGAGNGPVAIAQCARIVRLLARHFQR